MSANIRNGLQMMDAVLAYGVDGLAEQNARAALLKELGLDPEIFFRELYVSRPATEGELLAQMDAGSLHTFVVGPIGCGKTTLLHHVLRQYCSQRMLPILLIDMKTAAIAKPDAYSITERIEDTCKQQVQLYLSTYLKNADGKPEDLSLQPDITTLAMLLVEPQFHSYINPRNFAPVQRLSSFYSLSNEKRCGVPFSHWLSSVLASDTDPLRSQVASLLAEFTSALGLFEHLFAMSEFSARHLQSNIRSKIVIAIDNLDAIEDPKMREQLKDWMRSQSSAYSPVATFTACVRPENVPAARVGRTLVKGLWGQGGAPILKLSVGESDVNAETVKEWEAYLAGQFYDRKLDERDYGSMTMEERQRQAFDDMVHVRRLNFVSKAVDAGRISGVKKDDLHAVSVAAKEVLNIGSISNDVRMQANGNRRVMLAGVANFIEYVVRTLELDWKLIGLGHRRKENLSSETLGVLRGSALKSLYYRFLGSGRPGESQPPVFDASVFDPVRSVLATGWKGRKLDPENGTKDVSRACRELLVLLGVYTACGNTRSAPSEYGVTVQSVADRCKRLGLAPKDVFAVIETIIQSIGVRFAGVFDIDHFLLIYQGEHKIDGTEGIIATDRCRRLLNVVIYMFNFLCERINFNVVGNLRYTSDEQELTYRGLVLPRLVEGFAPWLAKAAVVETWWIEAVQAAGPSPSLKDAYRTYLTEFVVKDRHSSRAPLLTQSVARSAKAYLEFSLDQHIQVDEKELRECYRSALNDVGSIDRKLQDVCNRLDRGETWGIPRNEPLRY